jgi:hypothetical protein
MENNGRFIATVFQPKQSLGKTPGMPTVSNLLRLKTAIARELQGSAVIRNRPHNVVWSAMKRANHLIRKADREALATTTTMPDSLLRRPESPDKAAAKGWTRREHERRLEIAFSDG